MLTIRGPLARASLRLGVLRLPDAKTRLGWLLSHLSDLPGSGIIYTLTVAAAEDTARLLREAGHDVRAYTGQTDPAEREGLEEALKSNTVKALVATSALGMGFDKPDLGFGLHLGAPSSPVAYYQQVGRAGRATDSADVLLLPGPEDRDIWSYFATASMPSEERASRVLRELADGSVLSTPALEALVNVRRTQLELLLKVLDVDGAVRRVRGGWESTGQPWTYDAVRYERIAAARTDEQQHMLDYESTSGCRMEFLQRTLDDDTAAPCGRCDSCEGVWYPVDVVASASASAERAIDRVGVPIEPRAQWPVGVERLGVRGRIPVEERAAEGRALARLTDLGWGNALRSVLAAGAPDAPVTRAMLDGCIRVLAQWGWEERPTSVVAMPSRHRPLLVDSLARGLAEVGRLPYAGALALVDGGPTGEPGGSSAFRLAAVWQRFDASGLELPPGPVLLVDDLVDSRWTMTVAARELRLSGAAAVLPFALATRG